MGKVNPKRSYKDLCGLTSIEPYPGCPYVVSEEPTGEKVLEEGIDCKFELQSCLRTFSDGTKVVVGRYYKEMVSDRNSDFCIYCGADNGPNGEKRQGFDCYFCGSN